jgi:alpha-amylase/alpha-mannosidase (GH57 family)
MKIRHLEADTPRMPPRPSAHEPVRLRIATWPITPGQSVWVTFRVGDRPTKRTVRATWVENREADSFWEAELGTYVDGDRVEYSVVGEDRDKNPAAAGPYAFHVGPKLSVALLWHQHQPLYRPIGNHGPLWAPWVRLHALRDYFSMPWLLAQQPEAHATINLTPVLLAQLLHYVDEGGNDDALVLTETPAERLGSAGETALLRNFFDAHLHNQIGAAPRYAELYRKREEERPFSAQDLRDLQMWFNLAWFGVEFRTGEVELPTGQSVSVRRFVEQGRDFSHDDVLEMVAEQRKLMQAVVPMHRALRDRGQLEISTTPFYHPILPLLIDSDCATIDRPGTSLPRRFAHPGDADAQVRRAQEFHERLFGAPAVGMWPAEGAVAQYAIPFFAKHGVRWIATDAGVLERSGKWGYRAGDPDVLCRPYRAEHEGNEVSVFFRDTQLSDAVGFRYHGFHDAEAAAADFVEQAKERFAHRVTGDGAVLSVILDGENAWGEYRDDGRPFLRALYRRLSGDPSLRMVTFSEALDGNPARHVPAHPAGDQRRIYELYTGSWADELASAPGVDLGTWIGEPEENRAWELLDDARRAFEDASIDEQTHPEAFDALYAAEGSDWFWWYGNDQDSGRDDEFDALFRAHVCAAYLLAGLSAPAKLGASSLAPRLVWRPTHKVRALPALSALVVHVNCPGSVRFHFDAGTEQRVALRPVGGVMAGASHFEATLPPAPPGAQGVSFRFSCERPGCHSDTCRAGEQRIPISTPNGRASASG